EPRDFCPDEIEAIQQYDADNNSELLLTLEKYLYYVDDPVSAAKSLNIHRNTLLYRINKIKELTGLDLSNGDERFKVQLYLKLSHYHKNTN
ncbi:MAG: helix-turn-helix domain-containing protein, partial [Oscillospiraceae bacterium]|nr:helix-turn-helix domain-containing protein [Oscillospiraceae bacterium]